MVHLQLKDPLDLFVKRKEFLPGFMFLPRPDTTKAVESDTKKQILFVFPCQHFGFLY